MFEEEGHCLASGIKCLTSEKFILVKNKKTKEVFA